MSEPSATPASLARLAEDDAEQPRRLAEVFEGVAVVDFECVTGQVSEAAAFVGTYGRPTGAHDFAAFVGDPDAEGFEFREGAFDRGRSHRAPWVIITTRRRAPPAPRLGTAGALPAPPA